MSQIPVTHEAILEALEGLLNDAAFQTSARNKQFLRFVVEETLAGRGHRIKSYTIAVDVFGRPADFDGAVDPIVRIEASRLRMALSIYYANPSPGDRLQIFLPKGGYVPDFRWIPGRAEVRPAASVDLTGSEPPAAPAAPPINESLSQAPAHARPLHAATGPAPSERAAWKSTLASRLARMFGIFRFGRREVIQPPTLFVDPIEALTDDAPTRLLARTLGQSLVSALGQYEGIRMSRKPLGGDEAVVRMLDADPGHMVYRFAAEVRIDRDTVRFWWYLSDVRTMEICRAASEEGPWRSPANALVETGIAERVAAAIAARGGLIPAFAMRDFTDPPQPGYPSIVRAQQYTMTLDPASFPVVRSALERTVAENPSYAEAWAYLAYVYADEPRNKYDTSRSDGESIALARQAAANALRLAPFSALTYFALMVVTFQAGDDADFVAAAERVLSLSPSDPKMLILAGNRFYALGHREYGLQLIRRGIEIEKTPAPMDSTVLMLDAYLRGEYREALSFSQSMPEDIYLVPLLNAACYGQLGDNVAAREQIRRLLALRPDYAGEMRADIRSRRYDQTVSDKIAEGLAKAGLEIPEEAGPESGQ